MNNFTDILLPITCPVCQYTWQIDTPAIPWRALPVSGRVLCASCDTTLLVLFQEKDGQLHMSIQKEKPFTVTYASANEVNAGTVSFECVCGTSLTITKHSYTSILSGTLCQKCDEQWWIRWSAGELHRGRFDQDPASDDWN